MTRTRRSAKTIGTAFETDLADYLAATLADDRIERRSRNGVKDRGDIAGIRIHGQPLVIEAKNCAHKTCTKCGRVTGLNLSEWVGEANREAGNADALTGIVVHKRRGTTDMGRQWVSMTVDDLCALIDGARHGHRLDQLDDGRTA